MQHLHSSKYRATEMLCHASMSLQETISSICATFLAQKPSPAQPSPTGRVCRPVLTGVIDQLHISAGKVALGEERGRSQQSKQWSERSPPG